MDVIDPNQEEDPPVAMEDSDNTTPSTMKEKTKKMRQRMKIRWMKMSSCSEKERILWTWYIKMFPVFNCTRDYSIIKLFLTRSEKHLNNATYYGEAHFEKSNRWWVDVRIKLKLCNIFQIRGMLNDFVDVSFPLVRESLCVATPRQQKPNPESPLFNLRKDEDYQLIIDLCNALASLQRYKEALEIISLTPRNSLSAEKNEKLQSLGIQMAYNTTDPKQGFDCVKPNVQQHAQSVAAWNSYYKVISRLEKRDTRHVKFLHDMQDKYVDCVPPILISAHQFTLYSHHQDAARKYLEAYKLLPENPLVNLCVGTALINLALGFRLKNRHQCVVQGLAFLYNNLKICGNNQESLFNVARAYHHVGLVTLAAIFYEKVIAISERDYIQYRNFQMRKLMSLKIINLDTATFVEKQLTICI